MELPEVCTQNNMPVSTENITTEKDLPKWPYLSNIKIPEINSEVEMLKGTNTPKVMEPWEVVNSCENGPYAVRTLLGWVVNGPLRSHNNEDKSSRPAVTASRICFKSGIDIDKSIQYRFQ